MRHLVVSRLLTLLGTGSAIFLGGACTSQVGESNASQSAALTSSGPFQIHVWTSSGEKCLDVANANTAYGATVQVWDCNGFQQQNWTLDGNQIVAWDGQCLDLTGYNTGNGTRLQTWGCTGVWNQQWTWDSATGQITVASSTPKCVDDTGDGGNGTPVQIWDCNGDAAQYWQIGTPAQCVPKTCAYYTGGECGKVPDGCGGTLNCSKCPDGQSCNNLQGLGLCMLNSTDGGDPSGTSCMYDVQCLSENCVGADPNLGTEGICQPSGSSSGGGGSGSGGSGGGTQCGPNEYICPDGTCNFQGCCS